MSINRIQNGTVWKDTEGNVLHAHGGHILLHNGVYYWYGENRLDDLYVSCYSSIDLISLALAQPYSYPFRLGQMLRCDYLNLGFAGSAQMEKAMAEYLVSRKDWDLASVEMGINMLGEQFPTEEFEKNIDEFTKILSEDGRPVFATSLYGFSDPVMMERGNEYRQIVEKYAKKRLIFIDGLKLLNNKTYISQDMVHPSLEGMEEISKNWYSFINSTF